jgi:hypothetical protein
MLQENQPISSTTASQPTHEQIRFAVGVQADPEFSAWTAKAENYVVRASDPLDLLHHRLFFIMPIHLHHPMSFYVAMDEDNEGRVMTDNPEGLAWLLASEPALMASEKLPEALAELFRNHNSRLQVVREASGLSESQQGAFFAPTRQGEALQFLVLVGGEKLESWKVTLGAIRVHIERKRME